ncbi:FAD-dependent oxidoreductase domain-containing protein 1-like [Neocloeon triangulifer]|uniref:FAD-dependent oxidoreductase domain-containing protein 1-like n=1 Tax=Neocloeon triangulifer TaxID=2078957 RepID=UPI00286F7CD0|nr:FAD-dependent oxidoreductase domain-containing protein 1-like [Neocloeon triangulifer]
MRVSRLVYRSFLQGSKLLSGRSTQFTSPLASYSRNVPGEKDFNPIKRTGNILKNDLIRLKNEVIGIFHPGSENQQTKDIDEPHKYYSWQHNCDVLIVGGGVIGSSIAFFLLENFPGAMNVTVIEKDPTYTKCATTLSCGGLRQQFSLPENILMSQFGAKFLRELPRRCGIEGMDPPDVQFHPQGYLFLATESGAEQLTLNHDVQMDLGVKNVLLTKEQLQKRFPWLNTEDIELGCLGLENEGWFDPWTLLNALRSKAIALGAHYVQGEGVGFEFTEMPDVIISGDDSGLPYNRVNKLVVRLETGEERKVTFSNCVIACGPSSGHIAELANVGSGPGMLAFPLPVEPRKRYVFNVHCPKGPGIDLPFVIDPTGTYVRREGYGGNYICGRSPHEGEPEPSTANFDVDHDFFDQCVWPHLAHRIPAMQELKVKSSWAGHYDYNTFDQNAILGPHPYHHNLYFATGFSGHGLQQAPAVGQAIMEMMVEGQLTTMDLSRFTFDRILVGHKVLESNIV